MTTTSELPMLLSEYLDYQKNNLIKGEPPELYEPANYILELPGKRVRPLLVLLGYQLFNQDWKKALPLAHAVELFHNFTLVHDDIIDNAPIRRGKPTVHEHWDLNRAILTGDAMLVRSYSMIQDLDCDPATTLKILKSFSTMAEDVCRGQQMDVNFERESQIAEDDYIEMIELKTSVLLGFCLQAGALLAGAEDESAQCLYRYGVLTGISFQIMDDYLDAFGNSNDVGKQVGGDIIEDKKTILWIELMSKISDVELTELNAVESNDQKIELVLNLFKKYKVDLYARNATTRYLNVADFEIDSVQTPNPKENLLNLTESLKHRES